MSSSNNSIDRLLVEMGVFMDFGLTCLGYALASTAKRTWRNYTSSSSHFDKIRSTTQVPISDLRSLISDGGNEKVVLVRGLVQPLPPQPQFQSSSSSSSTPAPPPCNVLVSRYGLGEKGVLLRENVKNFTIEDGMLHEGRKSPSVSKIPFMLSSGNDYVVVNLDESNHPLPITTVYHHLLEPVEPKQLPREEESPIIRRIVVDEGILPLGKEISAIGKVYSSEDGIPEIKGCEDLPYFLSDKTKAEMVADLWSEKIASQTLTFILGSLSLGVLAYASWRIWRRLKRWERRVQLFKRANVANVHEDEADEGGIPEGQLCVVCLSRRRTFVFVPCGHMVCCRRCARSVQRSLISKCPLCRKAIETSVKLYL